MQDQSYHVVPPRSSRTQRPAASRHDDVNTIDDSKLYETRLPTSTRRYYRTLLPEQYRPTRVVIHDERRRQQPRRRHVNSYPVEEPPVQAQKGAMPPRFHWTLFLGGGMVTMLLLVLLGAAGLHWWNGVQEDQRYGYPRTYQVDERVGHNDEQTPSHFIAINLNRHTEIIELPGGDASKARVYIGPVLVGPEEDRTPVTLEFQDVNGDGQLDMIEEIGSSRYVFLNDHGQFRPARPDDHIQQQGGN